MPGPDDIATGDNPATETQEPAGGAVGPDSGAQAPAGGDAPSGGAPAGEPVGSDPQAAPPSVSQQAFDDYTAAQAEEYQKFTNQMYNFADGLQKELHKITSGLPRQQPPTQQPHSQPGQFPDYNQFQEALQDPYNFYQTLAERNKHYQSQYQEVAKRLDAMEQASRVREDSQRWYDFIDGQVKQATSQHRELQNPETQKMFEHLVIAHAQNAGGNWQRMNIAKLAKDTVAWLNGYADSKYNRTPAPGQTGPGAVPPAAPPGSGAPSKPGVKPVEVTDMESFEEAQERLLPGIADLRVAEMGEE